MKTITLTRQRLVQSQLNPAHYTTDGAMLRASDSALRLWCVTSRPPRAGLNRYA
jgi:hypothetical protein